MADFITYEYRHTKVNLFDNLTPNDEIDEQVRHAVDWRLGRNISMSKDLTKTDKNLDLHFVSPEEERDYPKNLPYIEVVLEDCTRKIWLKYGLRPEDVTDDDIDVTKKMWYNPINVFWDEDDKRSFIETFV